LLKKRLIIVLTFLDGVLFRTKKFIPDYRYTKNFVGLYSIDELIVIDISKKKFSNNFLDTIDFFSNNCFVPITVGGGIKNLDHADTYFKNGADKIILGTGSIVEKNLIKIISGKYGSQSIIQSIDIKKNDNSKYKMSLDSGKNLSEINPLDAIDVALENGAGEILINNVDLDGSLLGYDIEIVKNLIKGKKCPFLALGGAGNWQHIINLFSETDISAACTQNIFHFTEESILSAKKSLREKRINIRN
tara:strand:- start:229 stop:969 length:741 start_codon:yes stop_codon:yes gene_type:complete